MFERNEVLTPLVERLCAVFQSRRRGDIVEHSVIRDILQCEPHTGHWQQCMNRVRRWVEDELSITVWPEVGVGYRLLTQAEQLQVPVIRTRRALRQVARGERSLEALPEKGLTAHQRRVRALRLGHSADLKRELRSKARTMELLARPVTGHPTAKATVATQEP
jgi:hypothetical protein